MKRLVKVLLLLSLLSAFQCTEKEDVACPNFVEAKIAELSAKPLQNPAARITAYQYRGQVVYYLVSGCCDQYNMVYDACGRVLCAPDGGISGRGDGQCPDFFAKATNSVEVWRDPR